MFLAKEKQFKKLVLILITFIYKVDISRKDITLDCILYKYYLVCFQKNNNNIEALINSITKINIITLIYTLKLSF